MNFKTTIIVAIICILATPVTVAGIPAQLRLDIIGSVWTDPSPVDAWVDETALTEAITYDLTITNHNGADVNKLFLLVALDSDPSNVNVNVNGNLVTPYDGIITNENKAQVTEALVKTGKSWVPYEYPGHGIYNYNSGVYFEVVNVPIGGDGILSKDESIIVPVNVAPIIYPVKIHFDAVGAVPIPSTPDFQAISFVPPSEDAGSYHVPEFPTIVLPVAAVLGILFFIQRRKKEV